MCLHILILFVFTQNHLPIIIGSCRVLEKADFQYEGTLRSNAVKKGKLLDMKMYSRLRTDK